MTESPKEEALRLAREAGLSVNDYGQVYATGSGAVLWEDLVRLIALARASQAQPEQGEGKCYECGKEFGPRATFELGVAIGKKQAQSEPPAGWVIVRDVPVAYISGNGSGRLVWPDRVQSKAKHLFQPLYAAAPSPTGEKE